MSPSQSTSDSNKERQKWTPESDRMLTAAVAEATEKGESVSWLKVAEAIPGRTNKNCRKRWHYKIANDFRKGPWSPEEDDRLRAAVEVHGTKWSKVSQLVETRNGDQCWKRWHDNLNPEYDHSPWTEEEDARLLQAVEEMGRSWRDIVNRHFPSRTSLGAKNRYGLLQRRIGNTTSSTSTSTKGSKKQKTDPERRNTLDSTVSEADMSDMMLLDNPNMFTNQAIDDMLMSAECDMSTNALVDWSWSVPVEDKHLPVTMTMDVATYVDPNSALVSSSSTTMCPTAVDFANAQQFTENYHTFMNVPSPTSSETQNLSRNNSSDSAQSSTSTISKEVQLRVTCMADQVQDVMSGMSTLLNNMMIKGDVSSVSFAVEQ